MENITGLGLTASGKRDIRSGREYDTYFDTSRLHRNDKIVLYGTNFDTLDKMRDIVLKTLDDTKKISGVLKGSTIEETSSNIWHFLYQHIQYVKDNPRFEELRRPLRTWADRKGDCDCYSIFASSVLANLGIPHAFRMAAYKEDFQHVYVVVPKSKGSSRDARSGYYVIDPVTDQYNFEVSYSKKYDKLMRMPVKYLDGIDSIAPNIHYATLRSNRTVLPPYGQEFHSVGMNGPGQTFADATAVAQDFLVRTKLHLVNTLEAVKKDPASVAPYVGDPAAFTKEIEMALAAWDNPLERQKVLNFLAKRESQSNINGLNGLFKNLWNGIKDGVKKVGDAIGNVTKKLGDGIATGAKAVANAAKEAGTAILRYNPVSLAIRGGLTIAFKTNLFNMSNKLGYGYYSDAQVQQLGMDLNELKNYRERLERVKKIWNGLQGKPDQLRTYILEGHEKGAKKRELPYLSRSVIYKNPLDGLGIVETAAGTAAASGVIATITGFLKSLADPKDLFKKGVQAAKDFAQDKLHQGIEKVMTPQPQMPVPVSASATRAISPSMNNEKVGPLPVSTSEIPLPGSGSAVPLSVQASTGGNSLSPLLLFGGLALAGTAVYLGSKSKQQSVKDSKGLSGTVTKPVKKEVPIPKIVIF